MSEPYTIFHKAADHLVKEYTLRKNGMIDTDEPIRPVLIQLQALIHGLTEIKSSYEDHNLIPGIILSEMEDNAGPITEFSGLFTIKLPSQHIPSSLIVGERVKAHVFLTIKPPGKLGMYDWTITYHLDNGSYRLAYTEIVFIEKMR